MVGGHSSIREVVKTESNRLKSDVLRWLTATQVEVESSNLSVPTKLDLSKVTISYNDIKRKLNLPKFLTEELAEDIGIQIGDGSITDDFHDNSHHYKIECFGNISEDVIYLEKFVIPLKKRLFNVSLTLKKHPIAGTCYIKFESKGLFNFYKNVIGLKINRKDNMFIPKIILRSPVPIKLACLRGIADTDFSLTFKKGKRKNHSEPYLSLGTSSKILVKQIDKILREMDVKPTIILDTKNRIKGRNRIYIRHYIQIGGKKNLEKWMGKIGFHNPVQITRYLIWKKFGFCPPRTTIKERLDILTGKLDPFRLEV